jgi:acyl-CoA reductase-like NAD-dependent aldehyde dehydrogenase
MANRYRLGDRLADGTQFIGGRLRPGTSGRGQQVVDPATGERIHVYPAAGPADVAAAVAAAKAAFPGWAAATPGQRPAALHRLATVLADRAEEFAHTASPQCGKPGKLSTEFDVPGTFDDTAFFAGAARYLQGQSAGEYSGNHTSCEEPGRLSHRTGGPRDQGGLCLVNDHIQIISEMPHGGLWASGFCKDMSMYSFEACTQVKHVIFDNTALARKDWHRTIPGTVPGRAVTTHPKGHSAWSSTSPTVCPRSRWPRCGAV